MRTFKRDFDAYNLTSSIFSCLSSGQKLLTWCRLINTSVSGAWPPVAMEPGMQLGVRDRARRGRRRGLGEVAGASRGLGTFRDRAWCG